MFQANSETLVVKLMYKWSDYFVSPFSSIFKDIPLPYYNNYVIDMATLVAMIGYAILIFAFFKLFKPVSR